MPEHLYRWDNWTTRSRIDNRLHRFSLTAPRELNPDERHLNAIISHWVSTDGTSWEPWGAALSPGKEGAPDEQAVWSGSAVDLPTGLALFYTGVSRGPQSRQTICVAFSGNGRDFIKHPTPILEPCPDGYDITDTDGVIMSWRDPHVFNLPADNSWHMLFGAKHTGDTPRGTIGHAVAEDDTLLRWNLRPPLDLPSNYTQMECPSILLSGKQIFLVCSSKDHLVPDEKQAGLATRVFSAKDIDGPWKAAGPDGSDLLLDWRAHCYALAFLPADPSNNSAALAGFSTRNAERPYSWSPPLAVHREGDRLILDNP
ncbi:glycoside hydrolase family 68 protein [Adhaeretor mobilis]|uniref:beta-fructofuranosidase n=1 Tax=Adhaeretor mobilis TaxID=1930276 RepID=A0A517MUH3_9BACT|nr:glycoside hydrolase family 68 protein [Adhaeretor mobilis]QDS98528.1 Extracellular sucrase [Adhaeretor mobilis]